MHSSASNISLIRQSLWSFQDVSAMAPTLERGNKMCFFFRLEFWGFAFLICLCLAWKQLSRSSVGIKQTDYKAGSMFRIHELSSRSREWRDVRQQELSLSYLPCEGGLWVSGSAIATEMSWNTAEYGITHSLADPLRCDLASVILLGISQFMNLGLL